MQAHTHAHNHFTTLCLLKWWLARTRDGDAFARRTNKDSMQWTRDQRCDMLHRATVQCSLQNRTTFSTIKHGSLSLFFSWVCCLGYELEPFMYVISGVYMLVVWRCFDSHSLAQIHSIPLMHSECLTIILIRFGFRCEKAIGLHLIALKMGTVRISGASHGVHACAMCMYWYRNLECLYKNACCHKMTMFDVIEPPHHHSTTKQQRKISSMNERTTEWASE